MKKLLIHSVFFIIIINQMCISQWQQCGSIRTSTYETLSNIRCFVADSVNLYVGANNVKCSTNNGMNWIEAGIVGFDLDFVNDLKYHDQFIYAATTEGVFVSPGYDIGWADLNMGLSTKNIRSLIFSNNTLYIGTYGKGVFKSTDFGNTWQSTSSDTVTQYTFCLAFYKNTLFACTNKGIVKSNNNGYTWTESNDSKKLNSVNTILVNGNSIFACLNDNGLYKSTNVGESWFKINNGLNTTKNDIFSLISLGNIIFAGTDDGIFMSTNDGNSWSCINDFLPLKDLFELELIVKDSFLIAGITPGGGNQTIVRSPLSHFGINLNLSITGSTIACNSIPSSYSTVLEKDVTINWLATNGSIIGSNSNQIVYVKWDKPGEGKLLLTKENKSLNKKDSSFVLIQVVNTPEKPVITKNINTLISSSDFGNQWYFNGKPIVNANGKTFNASINGKYTVDVYYNDFKSEISDVYDFVYTGVEIENLKALFEINPNPANERLLINYQSEFFSIRIINCLGNVVLENLVSNTFNYPVEINTSNLPDGIYFCKIESYNNIEIKKFTIIH